MIISLFVIYMFLYYINSLLQLCFIKYKFTMADNTIKGEDRFADPNATAKASKIEAKD